MTAPVREAVLVRYGEIFLKGRNRPFFERLLVENARHAVRRQSGARIERLHHRLCGWPGEAGAAPLAAALRRVFGVTSVSRAALTERTLPAICSAAVALVGQTLAGRKSRPSFKVETQRSDKRFQPASPEVSRQVGAAIVAEHGLAVDLHQPDLVVGVEIGSEYAFVFAGSEPGPGGLPVGSSGRVDLLLSGGIDSPVAGWMMQKRGCQIGATYFHSFPYTGDKTRDKVLDLARILAGWQSQPLKLKVVGFTDTQKQLRAADPDGRLAVVLYRRMMIRVAERLAREAGALALATGEALGQVASQTLENMAVIDAAATALPVLRPLVAHDKQETIAVARRIGTYDTSIAPYEDCCSLFVPEHPETRAKLAEVLKIEAKLDLAALVEACVATTETIVATPV